MRAAVLVLLGACGSVSETPVDGMGSGSADADPTAPPSVVTVMPENMATGVAPDSKIVIQFSKPMDQASVQSAWTSSAIPASDVAFSWNAGGDTLSVTPNQLLPVAQGTGLDPSTVTATSISYMIAGGATDTTGKQLGTPLSVTFKTFRRLSVDATLIDALTQSLVNDNTVISPPSGGVGDSNFSNTFFRVFASFTLPSLPAGAQLERATFQAPQESITGTPYGKLGSLKLQHVTFAAFDTNTFAATPLASLGDLSNTATIETKTFDVTARVTNDYVNATARGNRSQYRLEFPTGTNNDGVRDISFFTRTGFALTLTYHVD